MKIAWYLTTTIIKRQNNTNNNINNNNSQFPFLVFFFFFFFFFDRYGQAPFDHWSKLGVNGPSPTIFLGNQLELFKPGGSMAAHTKWQKLYGQIYGIYNFRRPQLVVTDPEVLRRILVKDFNNFTDRSV